MTKEKAVKKDFLGLRTKREALGITLKDVFLSTRVSVVNLEAIENGDFHDLPVPIYTKNFIKKYAGALDIDSKPILESYDAYLNSLQIAQTQTQEVEPEKQHFTKIAVRYKKHIWTASIVFVIAVVAFFIAQQYQPSPEVTRNQQGVGAPALPASTNAPVNPPAQSNTQSQPVAQATAGAQPQPVAPATANEKAKQPPATVKVLPEQKSAPAVKASPEQNALKIKKTPPAAINEEVGLLIIKSTEETWLRIKIDQNPPFQVLLSSGETIERRGASFDMDIGNAGGITMSFRGKSIENLGKSGQVIHLRLP
jgi:cytoskeletal protein RodZ